MWAFAASAHPDQADGHRIRSGQRIHQLERNLAVAVVPPLIAQQFRAMNVFAVLS
jgi:hypothetical protein